MAVIQAQPNPIFRDEIRSVAQDDGGDITLDKVDVIAETLLNNTKAAYNKAVIGSNLMELGAGVNSTQRVGVNNTAEGDYAASLSGHHNDAGAVNSLIAGGHSNIIHTAGITGAVLSSESSYLWAAGSIIVGGEGHNVPAVHMPYGEGAWGAVIGGRGGDLRGRFSAIIGGDYNNVSAAFSATLAGEYNDVSEPHAAVVAGNDNTAEAIASAVIGGSSNRAAGDYGIIAGGYDSNLFPNSERSGIIGGNYNVVGKKYISPDPPIPTVYDSGIVGGDRCDILSSNSFIGGGHESFIHIGAERSSIIGGADGIINTGSQDSILIGGNGNELTGECSIIVGGHSHIITHRYSAVLGGFASIVAGAYAAIIGGDSCSVDGSSTFATIAGGYYNTVVDGAYSFIGGGSTNRVQGPRSAIVGGNYNVVMGRDSLASGLKAKANHNNCFVWAGQVSPGADFATTAAYQFIVKATGNIGLGTNDPKAMIHGVSSTILGSATSNVADGDLGAGQVNIYLDETGDKLKFKVKYSDGTTIKIGEVALT